MLDLKPHNKLIKKKLLCEKGSIKMVPLQMFIQQMEMEKYSSWLCPFNMGI